MTVADGNMYQTHHLPEPVTQVKKEVIKSFTHSKRVGGYLLGRTLGVGSFAKVKEALHLATGEKVAVKVIDKKRAKTDNYVRKNLRREGKLLQMVRHPNVVSLFEVMETDNSYYLVTELCRGGDLMEYISSKKRLPENEVVKYIRQIVSAVDYLHKLGIIHRDLKIENLLLDGNKDIKLIDFGLSNLIKVANSPEGTRAQEFCVTQCGSPAYAAPELLNHEKYGLQVDLWSIGVNMYAMLTGGLPFTVDPFNIKALYAKMRDRQMNPLPDDISRECRDLLRKFLNPDPARRTTIIEALSHPWLMQGNKPVARHPFPNRMKTSDLEADILSHMSENLGFRMGEVIKFVTNNIPSSACATYHLYLERFNRYKAQLRASGQVPAPTVSKPNKETNRITLHLQDMRPKPSKDQQQKDSAPEGSLSPVPRLQSRGVASVATDATDTTTTTSTSKKDSGTDTGRAFYDNSLDKKENKNPLTRYNSINLINNVDAPSSESPAPSESKGPAINVFTPRSVLLQPFKEPVNKNPSLLGTNDQLDVGKNLIEKLTQNAKFLPENNKIGHLKDKFAFAHVDNDFKNRTLPSPHRVTPRSVTQHKTEVVSTVSQQSEDPNLGEAIFDGKLKLYKASDAHYHRQENVTKDSNNNESLPPSRPRRYIQNNKLLSKRGVSRSIDVKKTGKTESVSSTKANCQPIQSNGKPVAKQFSPFRSAQERPRMSENCPPHYLKHPEKAKTSESLTLHGKNLLNTVYSETSNSVPKRAVSPPPKPIVIRRKLVKRHRVGELTPPGSLVIQDIDHSVTTDLVISDLADAKTDRGGKQSSPLPHLSPLHSYR